MINELVERTGWSEAQILAFCGAAVAAACVTALITALRVVDVVVDALPRTPHGA